MHLYHLVQPTPATVPTPASSPDLDFLGIGELLVDFIADEAGARLQDTRRFRRHLGGSPSHIAVNMARLGGRAALIARVGDDPFGRFLRAELERQGVITRGVITDPASATSLVFIARSATTPEFMAVRGADARLQRADILPELIDRARIIHASTFALASPSAREAIHHAFRMARDRGKLISLDPNYSPQLWPDRDEALRTLAQLYPLVTLTKPSLDDAQRLFGPNLSPQAYLARFHNLGAEVVVLSMGASGVLISPTDADPIHIPAHALPVVDATGAGDAFWAGFLTARLEGKSWRLCGLLGRAAAELKLQRVGPLSNDVDREALWERALADVELT